MEMLRNVSEIAKNEAWISYWLLKPYTTLLLDIESILIKPLNFAHRFGG